MGPPSPKVEQTDRQTCVKTLPSCTLRMWAVTITTFLSLHFCHSLLSHASSHNFAPLGIELRQAGLSEAGFSTLDLFEGLDVRL